MLNAQYMLIEKFNGNKIESGGIVVYRDPEKEELTSQELKEILLIIKNGSVITETYDSDQNCEITYSIHGKDLKQRLINLDS